jgi:hypothetical protein
LVEEGRKLGYLSKKNVGKKDGKIKIEAGYEQFFFWFFLSVMVIRFFEVVHIGSPFNQLNRPV